MITSSLPPFGLAKHSEQVGTAALEARAWQMRTELVGHMVVLTSLLGRPPDDVIEKLERAARHGVVCKDPACPVRSAGIATMLCPGGKFDTSVRLFFTAVMDPAGFQIHELATAATDPETAIKNHHAACVMVTGTLSQWAQPEDKRA